MGRLAPGNIRKVVIAGVPYWQVLDVYDFDHSKNRVANGEWGEVAKETVGNLQRGNLFNAQRNIPSLLGLQYNMNLLVPTDPRTSAPPESVEAFRQSNRLPYPNNTLGRKLTNALMPYSPEKVMP